MKKLSALLAALFVIACAATAGSAQAYALEYFAGPTPAVQAGPLHWWIGASRYVVPRIIDHSNATNMYFNMVPEPVAGYNPPGPAEPTRPCFKGNTTNDSGYPTTCPGGGTAPVLECTVAQASFPNYCPGATDGSDDFYDGNYGATGWAAATFWNGTYQWDGVNGIPGSANFTHINTLLNTYSGYTNQPMNTTCHEMAHAMGLNHRYDYPAVASCINDTVGGSGDCKWLLACQWLSQDDYTGLWGMYNSFNEPTGYRTANLAYALRVPTKLGIEARLVAKYGNNIPAKLRKEFGIRIVRASGVWTTKGVPFVSSTTVLNALAG